MCAKKKRKIKRFEDVPHRQDSERRLRQAFRIARCLKLLQLLQGRGRLNIKDLAVEVECVERTVRRDLAALELAGIPWYYDASERAYRIRNNYWFPALNLNDEELLGQAVATSIAKAPGLDIASGAEQTSRKLSASADERSAGILADAQQLVTVLGLKLADHSRHREMLTTVQWSLIGRKQLTGQYLSPYEAKSVQLKLHPYRLCLVNQAWYLIARPLDATEPKTYRVARFKSLRMTDATTDVPGDFDLREYFGNAWAVYRGKETHEVRLRFNANSSRIVTETTWHPTQEVVRQKNGSVELKFQVDGLQEILWWVLGWTGQVEVIEPIELRKLVAEQLRTALKLNS